MCSACWADLPQWLTDKVAVEWRPGEIPTIGYAQALGEAARFVEESRAPRVD